MINRELIRLKVVQSVYSNYKNAGQTLQEAKDAFKKGLDATYELYQYQLLLIPEVTAYARELYESSVERARAKNADMPSARFVNNRLAAQLGANDQLNAFMDKKEKTKGELYMWDVADMEFRSLLRKITSHKLYKEYMAAKEDNYEADRVFWIKAYKWFVCDNDHLAGFLEDENLFWNDDRYIIDEFVIKTIRQMDEAQGAAQELMPQFKDEVDEAFANKLFEKAVLDREEYEKILAAHTRNWTLNRLPVMDRIIMTTALTEMVSFPEIPIGITMNEYINIAKMYSDPKNASYINGMLDSAAKQLTQDHIINKK